MRSMSSNGQSADADDLVYAALKLEKLRLERELEKDKKKLPPVVQPQNFAEQFESGAFSDCRVKCGDRVWNLHRVILASRSRWFANVCRWNSVVKEPAGPPTNEIVLDGDDIKFDPECADWALRYIYACNLSHLDHVEKDDSDGLELVAYKTYVPLYVVADFLGLDDLCRDIISRLHRTNRRIAARVQRHGGKESTSVISGLLPETFRTDFVECAKLAYSIPPLQSAEDCAGFLPGGIRNPFIELFEFVRYSPFFPLLSDMAGHVPDLLVDLIMSMRGVEGVGRGSAYTYNHHATCEECGVNPISGIGKTFEELEGKSQFRVQNSGSNFWVRDYLCFECSLHYPRDALMFTHDSFRRRPARTLDFGA